MTRFSLILATLLVLTGCTAYPTSTSSRPDAYYDAASSEPSDASLFAGDDAVLSDVAINAILNYDYSPPPLSRIALMPFGREIWSTWSEGVGNRLPQKHGQGIRRTSAGFRPGNRIGYQG